MTFKLLIGTIPAISHDFQLQEVGLLFVSDAEPNYRETVEVWSGGKREEEHQRVIELLLS